MDTHTVLILGNGFDLDLGWETSYKAFYKKLKGRKSFRTDKDNLFQFVKKQLPVTWFDFERVLHEYTLYRAVKNNSDIDKDVQDYVFLKKNLIDFLKKASESNVNKDSYAYRILEAYVKAKKKRISDDFFPFRLFSFNYTPLLGVIKQIDENAKIPYIPVHGRIEDNSIIFGIHDDPKVPKPYRFLQKSMDANYKSSNVVTESMTAKNIIFFGLSLGYIDGEYFKNIFSKISNLSNPQMINKNLYFITKDPSSELSIKNNLLDMGINLQLLFNSSNVHFIYTDDKEKSKTEAVFNKLIERLTTK